MGFHPIKLLAAKEIVCAGSTEAPFLGYTLKEDSAA